MKQQTPEQIQWQMYQNDLRRALLYWHKVYVKDRQRRWDQLIFHLSMCRAVGYSWATIGEWLDMTRQGAWSMFDTDIYPDRKDIVQYAGRIQRNDQYGFQARREARELWGWIKEEDAALFSKVAEAREQEASWDTIGRALGITRQAASQRFGPHGRVADLGNLAGQASGA